MTNIIREAIKSTKATTKYSELNTPNNATCENWGYSRLVNHLHYHTLLHDLAELNNKGKRITREMINKENTDAFTKYWEQFKGDTRYTQLANKIDLDFLPAGFTYNSDKSLLF